MARSPGRIEIWPLAEPEPPEPVPTTAPVGMNSLGSVATVFHVFGLGPGVIGTLLAGSSLVLQEQFEPGAALDLIEKHGVTVHYGVPTVYITEMREADRPKRDLSSLRIGIVAGAPIGEAK